MTLCEIVEEHEDQLVEFIEMKYHPLVCRMTFKNTYDIDTIPLHKYCVRPVLMCFVEGNKIFFELS